MEIKKLNEIPLSEKGYVIVTGVTGQDGSHMVDYLLKHTEYTILGSVRKISHMNYDNLIHIKDDRFALIHLDISDNSMITNVIKTLKPKFFINFAAQSNVIMSWECVNYTMEANTIAVMNILEAIRTHAPECRFFNAGSSEEFGVAQVLPQDETHPICPINPYGISKAASRFIIESWRTKYNLFGVQSWSFNHEGIRRGPEFVTRKITNGLTSLFSQFRDNEPFLPLELGNLDISRDWSSAEDFMAAIWLMLNNTTPVDYVLSSNESHTIREFLELTLDCLGIRGEWVGVEENEKYVCDGKTVIKVNPKFYRPGQGNITCGNSSKIEKELNWKRKHTFKDLVSKMTYHDFKLNVN